MNISVIGLWRDSSQTIQRTLTSLENLNKLQDFNFSFYFYENDSVDDTVRILKEWLVDKNGDFYSETLNTPKFGSVPDINRLILLSYYRNQAKRLIDNINTEYTLLIDTDIIFEPDQFILLYESILKTQASMVVANTRQHQIKDLMENDTIDSFYDVFAFRDSFHNNGLYFTDCPFILDNDRILWKKNQPVNICSGFSGFSLIQTKILQKNDCYWSTCGHSEHINFCSAVSRYGKIFMCPACKPKTDINLSSINIDSCEKIALSQKDKINQINQIFQLSISNNLFK